MAGENPADRLVEGEVVEQRRQVVGDGVFELPHPCRHQVGDDIAGLQSVYFQEILQDQDEIVDLAFEFDSFW